MGDCECGLMYAPWHPPDMRLHRRWHDAWKHGVKLSSLQSDRVIANRGELEVLVIAPNAPRPQRHRAELVGSRANKETRFDFGVYSECESSERDCTTHAFIARINERAVGLVGLRQRQGLWQLLWNTDGTVSRVPAVLVSKTVHTWTIDFAWTHRDRRRQGVATFVVRIAAQHLGVATENLAWETPFTPEGEALAHQLSPEVLYVA